MEFPIINYLPFFFPNRWYFFFIRLFYHILRAQHQTNQWLKNQMSSMIKLLAGTKVYYCFISKGDNFNENKL